MCKILLKKFFWQKKQKGLELPDFAKKWFSKNLPLVIGVLVDFEPIRSVSGVCRTAIVKYWRDFGGF